MENEELENEQDESLCQTCQKNQANGSHTCPYAEELHGSDHECNCCDRCTHGCAMDI